MPSMHGHRLKFLEACQKCMQSRRASTAVKLKPTSWDRPAPVPVRQDLQPLLSKWKKPAPNPAPLNTAPTLDPRPRQQAPTPYASELFQRRSPRQPGSASTASLDPGPSQWTRIVVKPPQRDPQSKTAEQKDTLPHTAPTIDRLDRGLAPHQVTAAKKLPNNTFRQVDLVSDVALPPASNTPTPETKEPDAPSPASYRALLTLDDTSDTSKDALSKRKHATRSKNPDAERKGSVIRQLNEHQPGGTKYTRGRAPRSLEVNTQKHDAPPVKRKKVHKSLRAKVVKVDVYLPSAVSVGQLAQLLDVRLPTLQRAMTRSGMEAEISPGYILTADYAALLAEEFKQNPIFDDELSFDIFPRPPHPDPTSLPTRPPVVTIMGHVDHGKTTLLDTLRSTSVAKGEAGGITQHIGAFSVPVPGAGGTITFLDTPGHAAFSAMRARGALVTDVIVLVVAADDGIMPQTREVINLIKNDRANVSVVVAINKVDKPQANVDTVKRALMGEGLELEDFGGDIPSVEVSGLTGHNLPTLVETLSAVAEMQDIRAEQDGPVNGYVLESRVTKGLGPVATVLVLRGSLKVGDQILAGLAQNRVRSMADSAGQPVKIAYPGMAVTVSGWKTLPDAGDQVVQGSESDIKKALSNRVRKAEQQASIRDVDAINKARREEKERREAEEAEEEAVVARQLVENKGPKSVKLMIKADVSGSAEAVSGAIHGIGNDQVKSQVISSAVGDVCESDILTAKAAGAVVVAFSVKVPKPMESLAEEHNVKILSSSIIYRLVDNVTDAVIDLLPKTIVTNVVGEATILQTFEITAKGKTTKVAGCRVVDGVMHKTKTVRVVRQGKVVHEGMMDTMRIMKKDVTEIRKGTECGLNVLHFNGIESGDSIQCYEIEELPGSI